MLNYLIERPFALPTRSCCDLSPNQKCPLASHPSLLSSEKRFNAAEDCSGGMAKRSRYAIHRNGKLFSLTQEVEFVRDQSPEIHFFLGRSHLRGITDPRLAVDCHLQACRVPRPRGALFRAFPAACEPPPRLLARQLAPPPDRRSH